MIDLPPFDALALSLHHSPGVHAILVGSGLSRAAGILTGWEITLDMIRRLAALNGVLEHGDWAAWYTGKYGKEPSYSEILDALASTPAERRGILHSYIESPAADDSKRKPTKAHDAIAQLVSSGAARVIITTNFDRLIENALRDIGIEPTVIASDDAIAGATPLVHAKCLVVKVHGDYLDARIKNTDSELAQYSVAMNGLLDQIFDNFGLLAVGWSGDWDIALRSALLRAPSKRYPFYWAARGAVSGLAQDLLDQRGGRSFAIADADTFFMKLSETLEALRQASRPHPLSVEMAVALAKRYCRDDQFEMEWVEYLASEVEKLRGYISGPEYPRISPTNDSLNGIVEAFITRSEVLRRMCLVCGRWGTDKANQAVVRAIGSLSFASEHRDGFTTNLSLREFGASLCFYWNTAGLLDRDAWRSVHALQSTEIESGSGKEAMVALLPFASYESINWKFLSGLENHYTPISVYLAEKFAKDAQDIALRESVANELFDRTEMAISLGYAHYRAARVKESGIWFWMPAGRFMWKRSGESLRNEVARIEALTDDDVFFQSGLFGGSKASAAPTLLAIREFQKKTAGQFW